MEHYSLLDRLQKRSKSADVEAASMEVDNNEDNTNESDVDDDMTLEECERFIKERNEKRFTKIKARSTELSDSSRVITSLDILPAFNVGGQENATNQPIDPSEKELTSDTEVFETHTTVKQKRVVSTAEERTLMKEKKEREKSEKQKKRQEIKLQKEMEKERLRAIKNADTMAARSEKKEECMDRILVVIDPCLVEEVGGGGDILKDLQDMNVRYELKPLPVVCCIGWMREAVEYTVDNNSKVNKSVSYAEEANIIHKMSAYELATRIAAQNAFENEEETFRGLVKILKTKFPTKKITIVVVGINAYHRLNKTKQNEEFRNKALGGQQPAVKRKKKEHLAPNIAKEEIDKHLIDLQITMNIAIRFCEDMSDVSKLISSFTKAMAEAPFRKTPFSALEFSTMLPNKVAYKISNDGHGMLQVWNQQLQQFYGVRNDTSIAITQLYPTPISLLREYQKLTPSEGAKLLQDIQVRRGVGVLQTQRRVGPELSKKLHKLLTSLDGNEILGK